MSPGVATTFGGAGGPVPAGLPLAGDGGMFWVIVVAGVIAALVLAGAIVRIRRMAVGKGGEPEPGLTIEQLEALRRQGTISDEEYRRARLSVLGLTGRGPAGAERPPTGESTEAGERKRPAENT